MTCPHCGQSVRDGLAVCPFCGADIATGNVPSLQKDKRQLTEGFGVGCFACIVMGLFFALPTKGAGAPHSLAGVFTTLISWHPLQTLAVLTVAFWEKRPQFARGLLYSLFVTAALTLGAFAVCR